MSDTNKSVPAFFVFCFIGAFLMVLTGKLTQHYAELNDKSSPEVLVEPQEETPAPFNTGGAGGKSTPALDANTHIPAHDPKGSASSAGDVNNCEPDPSDCPSCGQSGGRFFNACEGGNQGETMISSLILAGALVMGCENGQCGVRTTIRESKTTVERTVKESSTVAPVRKALKAAKVVKVLRVRR